MLVDFLLLTPQDSPGDARFLQTGQDGLRSTVNEERYISLPSSSSSVDTDAETSLTPRDIEYGHYIPFLEDRLQICPTLVDHEE